MNNGNAEEFIKALRELAAKEDETFAPYTKAAKAAVELFLQQEPVKPNATHNGLFCGNCDKYIRWFDKFCPACGKKVGKK